MDIDEATLHDELLDWDLLLPKWRSTLLYISRSTLRCGSLSKNPTPISYLFLCGVLSTLGTGVPFPILLSFYIVFITCFVILCWSTPHASLSSSFPRLFLLSFLFRYLTSWFNCFIDLSCSLRLSLNCSCSISWICFYLEKSFIDFVISLLISPLGFRLGSLNSLGLADFRCLVDRWWLRCLLPLLLWRLALVFYFLMELSCS